MSFNYLQHTGEDLEKKNLVDLPRKAQATTLSSYLWQTITLKVDHSFSISVLYNEKQRTHYLTSDFFNIMINQYFKNYI
jgi:hypothetical protein